MRGEGTPSRTLNEAAGKGREREVTLSLVAPNKATLAFQDERQVYRREFMRAELQRGSSWVRAAKDGRACREKRERESGEGEEERRKERDGASRVDPSRLESSQRLHPGCRARETLSIFIPWGSVHRRYLRRHWRILRAIVTKTTTSKDNSAS